MKFVYIDESGSAVDPFLTFFGLEVDAYRLKSAHRDVSPIMNAIQDAYPEALRELKSSRLVNGVGAWREVDATERKSLFLDLCRFADEHKHGCFAYVLDTSEYTVREDAKPAWAATPWLSAAMAVVGRVQRVNGPKKNNKGHSVLVFDHNAAQIPKLTTLIASEPSEFVSEGSGDAFSAIVDTAFSIKSEQSSLVQVADACAFALRGYSELSTGNREEAWTGESAFFRRAVSAFFDRIVRTQMKCPAAEWFKSVSHDLGQWELA